MSVSSRRIPDVQNDAGPHFFFYLMKYLYIDESYDQNVFVIGGIIAKKEKDVNTLYNKFKKQIKEIPLPRRQKDKITYEFKSILLDRSYPKIKRKLLLQIKNSDLEIIYSYKTLYNKLKQKNKEYIYITLLKKIIENINDDVTIVTFDSFNQKILNNKITNEILKLNNVTKVICKDSYDSKGLQFADNVVGTIRRHLSGIDINNDYEIISNKVIGV